MDINKYLPGKHRRQSVRKQLGISLHAQADIVFGQYAVFIAFSEDSDLALTPEQKRLYDKSLLLESVANVFYPSLDLAEDNLNN